MDRSFIRPDLIGSQPYRHSEQAPRLSWRTYLLGRPLSTADAPHQAIGKGVGLAVFSSDALSSTAYATQEIMMILATAGTVAFAYLLPISLAIVLLLVIVMLMNLRGVKESGLVFAVPTYFFVATMFLTVGTALLRSWTGMLGPVPGPPPLRCQAPRRSMPSPPGRSACS